MPTIRTGDKVLITGANGYIAMWATRLFLERGYRVRGTVRSEDKANFVEEYFSALGYGDNLEMIIVEDITREGAFDEAVKDIDAIAHLATPFPSASLGNPEEIIRPAVQGTVGILHSAIKNGNKMKRIIVTSSSAAVMTKPEKPTKFSELDWNTEDPKKIEEQGLNTPAAIVYRASKALAERGAWELYKKHKYNLQWDLTVLNPPGVFGPPIHDVKSSTSLNTSLQIWCNYVFSGFALAHVLALEKCEAGGERIIVTEGPYIFQEWLDIANSTTSSSSSQEISVGFPEILEGERIYEITYDTSKEERILDIKFHNKVETTKDTLENFAKRGW